MSRVIRALAVVALLGVASSRAQDAEPIEALPAVPIANEEEFDAPRHPNPLIDFIYRTHEVVEIVRSAVFGTELDFGNEFGPDEIAQWRVQFKPMASAVIEKEFKFVQMICKPTAAQKKQLKSAQKPVSNRLVERLVEWQKQALKSLEEAENPYAKLKLDINAEIRRDVEKVLTPKQLAELDVEWKKRADFMRRSFSFNAAVELDATLLLTPQQREQVQKKISEQFDESWLGSRLFGENEIANSLSVIPEKVFLDLLTDDQKVAWKNRPDTDEGFFGFDVDAVMEVELEEGPVMVKPEDQS